MKLDDLDIAILKELKLNSKLTFKEIGERLHLTGQAVGNRVNKLIENNIIENFTININENYLGFKNTSYVRIYMKDNSHDKILNLINDHNEIVEAYKTGSDCCYVLKIENDSNHTLTALLDKILPFANYQISMVLEKIK
ncbi:AsnC family transcriptional regulator [uncultured Clostridium sp.]|uniref:Lrp/AsnC family transcriptional regulator n=1 Tax=uncultured Clostridium sp. TaxID=59620 RepID=UPI0026035AAA|nr:AsnC family transcriptional regulator [uncultured Clostridium sp.]